MAKRYSGELVIQLRYSDNTGIYYCTVSRLGKSLGVQTVGAPACLTHAVDCPAAYDDTAHAALSFLSHAGVYEIETYAATNDTGWHIGRSKKEAYPK